MKQIYLLSLLWLSCFCAQQVIAQSAGYTVGNAHSHNDYWQPVPFWTAYRAGFGSIEADIFLRGDSLYVGHDWKDLRPERTLESLYLTPLLQVMQEPGAHKVQMLIELKTDAVPTLTALIHLLETAYPALVKDGRVRWAITGKLPDYHLWNSFPAYIGFDGDFTVPYPDSALGRVALFSADLKQYTHWYGEGDIPASDRERLEQVITHTHTLGKPVRFWDAPDNANAWTQLMGVKVDWINTDHIQALASFLGK